MHLGHFCRKHNGRNSRLYQIWLDMRRRCLNPARPEYKYYGGRGVKVCARWAASFDDFATDMGEPPADHSLDRINNNGHYEPSNCRWASEVQQQRNRSNTKLTIERAAEIIAATETSTASLETIAKEYGVSRALVRKIRRGETWPGARSLYQSMIQSSPEVK